MHRDNSSPFADDILERARTYRIGDDQLTSGDRPARRPNRDDAVNAIFRTEADHYTPNSVRPSVRPSVRRSYGRQTRTRATGEKRNTRYARFLLSVPLLLCPFFGDTRVTIVIIAIIVDFFFLFRDTEKYAVRGGVFYLFFYFSFFIRTHAYGGARLSAYSLRAQSSASSPPPRPK